MDDLLTSATSDLSAAAAPRNQPIAAVFFGSPYATLSVPFLPTMLITYDFGDYTETAVARALAGELPVRGTLPIAIAEQWPVGFGLQRVPALTQPR